MPVTRRYVYVDTNNNNRPLTSRRRERVIGGARLYDLVVPRDYDYEVIFRMRGQVPRNMVDQTCTVNGLLPNMNMLGADLFMHCFDRAMPQRGIRRNYRVNVTTAGDETDSDSSFDDISTNEEREMIEQFFGTPFD